MEEVPRITIITPSFNQAAFIERTLDSVSRQQVDFPVEHIVIDGGSTDGTLEILRKNAHRIRFISENDSGMPEAVNKGIDLARGEIIGWLNSDDVYLPDALAKAAGWFDSHPEGLWLYGNCRIVDENDREIRKWITAYKNRLARRYSYGRLLVENFISQPAVFMRRQALVNAGRLDPELPTAMDYDLWLRLAKLGSPGYLDKDLACFRVHGRSISARNYRKQFEEQYLIHRRYDTNRRRLLIHRLKAGLIVSAYTVMEMLGSLRVNNR